MKPSSILNPLVPWKRASFLPLTVFFTIVLLSIFISSCGGQEDPTPTKAKLSNTDDAALQTADESVEVQTAEPEPTLPPTTEPTASLEPTSSPIPLPLTEFFENSFREWLLRNPELISSLGLAGPFNTGNDELTEISDGYIRETQALEVATLEQLRSYDRTQLNPDQQLSYDIYEWYLRDLVDGHQWMYHDYPLTFFITSVAADLELFMTDLHPIVDKKGAEDYITRLSQVDEKFTQLLDGLGTREELGVIPPRFVVDWTAGDLRNMALRMPKLTPYYSSFAEKVNQLDDMSSGEKTELLAAAEDEIGQSVIPGYQAAADYLEELSGRATDEDGAWKLPDGRDYYAYTLRHHTTTDMTADEIHQVGLQELERIQAEIRSIAADLGFSQEMSLRELYAQAGSEAGTLTGQNIVTGYEALIKRAENEILPVAFDLVPEADVIVIGGDEGAYYVQPSLDGSRPGAFYARTNGTESIMRMPSLTFHEAVPGHHTQIAIARELEGLPSFRTGVDFNGYVEGWALYAERLAADLGIYDDDPYGDLGRLQFEAWRAARLVVDTGIHDKKWTYDQAVDFMVENTGLARPVVEYEVARYVVFPGQAASYMVGMLKILELRQKAMDELGDLFNLKDFHNLILGSGSVPLEILDGIVDNYIQETKAG